MKRLRISLVALLAMVISFGAMSFQLITANSQQNVPWQFNSQDPNDIEDAGEWIQTSVKLPGCGSGELLPCTIYGPANPALFASHLASIGNADDIREAAEGLRNPQ